MANKKKISSRKQAGVGISNFEIPAALNTDEVPSVYSNTIEVLSMNHIDVRIAFNEVQIETGNVAKTMRRANVVMPAHAFLMMVQILVANAKKLVTIGPQQATQEQAELRTMLEKGIAVTVPEPK